MTLSPLLEWETYYYCHESYKVVLAFDSWLWQLDCGEMVAVMDLSSEILRFITMSFGPHRMQWTTTWTILMYLYTTLLVAPQDLLQCYNYGYAFVYKVWLFISLQFVCVMPCTPHKKWWPTNRHYSTTKGNFSAIVLRNWHWWKLMWWCS